MKFLLLLGLITSSSFASDSPTYQVISSHPHDVEELAPYITTVKKEGRLWLAQVKDGAPTKILRHLRSIEGRVLKSYLAQPEKLKITTADSQLVQDYTNQVSLTQIKSNVLTLSSYKTRLVGSADNKSATLRLQNEFAALGYKVSTTCHSTNACSVIADKAGTDHAKEVILIMGHFDSVGKDFAGADDNGSGTAVLLEMARTLQHYPNKHNIRFFATNGEESGLLGAEHYADELQAAGTVKDIILAINMDMVGYNANGIVELETDSQYENLAKWFAALAQEYTTLKSKITLGAWGSDHVPFIKKDVPTLLTIEDWSTKTPCYHAACDKPDTINYQYATEIGKLNIAAVLTKDLE